MGSVVVKNLGERTATIEVEGFDSFDITYQVPGQRAIAELAEKYQNEDGETIAFKFGDMFDFSLKHLKSWGLDIACDEKGLDSIEISAVTGIFVEIFKEAQAAKN